MHKHKDLGFTFTVETDTEIPKDLTELFFHRMSNIDESLLTYYKDIEFTKSKNFLLHCEDVVFSLLLVQHYGCKQNFYLFFL